MLPSGLLPTVHHDKMVASATQLPFGETIENNIEARNVKGEKELLNKQEDLMRT